MSAIQDKFLAFFDLIKRVYPCQKVGQVISEDKENVCVQEDHEYCLRTQARPTQAPDEWNTSIDLFD